MTSNRAHVAHVHGPICAYNPSGIESPVARASLEKLLRRDRTELKMAERELARFFEFSSDLFCIASFSGYFLRVNPNFSRVLGYSNEELLSRPFLDFVHPDDLAATRDALTDLTIGNAV